MTTLHLGADGPNDTLHYLWDFIGNPSVLLALTPPSTSLNISWEDYLTRGDKSLHFSEKPVYTFGVIINKVTLSLLYSLLSRCLMISCTIDREFICRVRKVHSVRQSK